MTREQRERVTKRKAVRNAHKKLRDALDKACNLSAELHGETHGYNLRAHRTAGTIRKMLDVVAGISIDFYDDMPPLTKTP